MRPNQKTSAEGDGTLHPPRWYHGVLGCGLCLIGLLPAVGCSYLVNPFVDELGPPSAVTTSSAQLIEEVGAPDEEPRNRGWEPTFALRQNPCTYHWPLWFEDPFVDKGSDDGQFAVTWEDALASFYCPTRAAVNFVALPVSMIVDPIWTIHCDDGKDSPETGAAADPEPSPT